MELSFSLSMEIEHISIRMKDNHVCAKGFLKRSGFPLRGEADQFVNFTPSAALIKLLKKEIEEHCVNSKIEA